MKVVNMTPHVFTKLSESGEVEWLLEGLPEDQCPRVSMGEELSADLGFIVVKTPTFGEVTNLPEEEAGTLIIVSAMVKEACPNRHDLVSPGGVVREAGVIKGARWLLGQQAR